MSYLPKDIINEFHKDNDKYRRYFIKKTTDYLLVDFTVLSVILSFFFTNLTNVSKIVCIILFLLAIIPKWYIISKRLREFIIPIEEFWDEYDKIEEKAKEIKVEEREKYVKKKIEEVYYSTKRKTTMQTHDYYTKYMRILNRYISFSFFCVVIVLLNLGFYGVIDIKTADEKLLILFDIIILSIFLISITMGFEIFRYFRKFLNNIKSFYRNRTKKDKT